MLVIKIDNKLLDACIDKYRLIQTGPENIDKKCVCCGSSLVPMRLDKSPNTENGGVMLSQDRFLFYGCRNCNTVVYDKNELDNYFEGIVNLTDYLNIHLTG